MTAEIPPPPPGPDMPRDVHVMPTFGREHETVMACWCRPHVTYSDTHTGGRVIVHRVAN